MHSDARGAQQRLGRLARLQRLIPRPLDVRHAQRALEEKLGMKLNVSPDSHFVGALGASIFALDRAVQGVTGSGAGVSSSRDVGIERAKHEARNSG